MSEDLVRNPPFVKACIGLYFKNHPEGYRGITGESYNVGDKPLPLSNILYNTTVIIVSFYDLVMQDIVSYEKVLQELDEFHEKFGEWIKTIRASQEKGEDYA